MIDTGYAWVIPFACFFIQGALFGSYRSYGLIYQVILEKFQVLRADASWPFSLCMTVIHLTGPISGCLNKYTSVRLITFLGCCLASLGIALCYFAQSVLHITLAIGLLQGFGIGLTYIQNSAIINEYFDKYRGTANGISLSGGTIGAFMISSLLEHTLKEYELKYSFLLLAVIITTTLPVSCLLKEPTGKANSLECADERSSISKSPNHSGHSVASRKSCDPVMDKKSLPSVFAILGNNYWSVVPGLSKEQRFSLGDNSAASSKASLIKANSFSSVFSIGKHSNHLLSESVSDISSNVSLIRYQSNGQTFSSANTFDPMKCKKSISPELPPPFYPAQKFTSDSSLAKCDKQSTGHDTSNDDSSVTLSYCSCEEATQSDDKLNQSLGESVREITKNPVFTLIALTHASYFWSVITFTMVIVDYSRDKGLPMNASVTLLNSFSIGDLIGRLASGIVLDSSKLKLKYISLFAITGIGGLMIATPAFAQLNYSYHALIVINVFMGLLSGLINVLLNNLFCFYIGTDLAALAFGLSAFISGILTLARPSLVGYFRDRSNGSYDGLFITLGVASLITGALWFTEPWINSKNSHTQFNNIKQLHHDTCDDRRNSAASCTSASTSTTSSCDRNCIHHKSITSIDTEKTLFQSTESSTNTFVPETGKVSTQKCKLDDDG